MAFAEWMAFSSWVACTDIDFRVNLPAFLPVEVVTGTRKVLAQVDWTAIPSEALGCMATLSLFFSQAEEQKAGAAIEAR